MKSYNESLKNNEIYQPYSHEEILELKETKIINPIRFKRLLATIDELKKDS